MPKEKVYGTPIGIAGGPSEKPSTATDRKVAKAATDKQVHEAVKAAKSDPWRDGREAPKRTASEKASGPSDTISDKPKNIIDALKNRGKRIDAAVEKAQTGE